MTQAYSSSTCDCCGLTIRPESGEDCPRCNYPISNNKEERFLEFSLRDLQRVSDYGGANLTVSGLIGRYSKRLNYLRQFKPGGVSSSFAAIQPAITLEQHPSIPQELQSEIAPVPLPILTNRKRLVESEAR